MKLIKIRVAILFLCVSVFAELLVAEELFVPPLLDSRIENNTRIFSLNARENRHSFTGDRESNVLSYNTQSYLGPTIRVNRGDNVRIDVYNDLSKVTTLHQHGMRLPASADGNTNHEIRPGKSWAAIYTVEQVAATLWYHPHAIGETARQVYNGLAGFLIIDDENSTALPLPNEYGVDDIPLIIQEKQLKRNGTQNYSLNMHRDMMGIGPQANAIVVNGSYRPEFSVTKPLIRIRILNGSNAMIHQYSFDKNVPVYLIANDAGLLERPLKIRDILLAPAERRELLIDFSGVPLGEQVIMQTKALGVSARNGYPLRADIPTMVFSMADDWATYPAPVIPANLVTVRKLKENGAGTRTFNMGDGVGTNMMTGRFVINGELMKKDFVNEKILLNTTEVWVIKNTFDRTLYHSFHKHDVPFQILRINGNPPPPELQGWKDTVLLAPGDTVEIISEFMDYTGIYLYHCHILEHEKRGMMGQFEVVASLP